MKNIIVTGSIAYDNIMFFDGEFKNSIIPEEIDHLSVSFIAKKRKKYFGGCSPNIAYTLNLLGEKPLIFSVAGKDFKDYEKWLKKNKITTKHIEIDKEKLTSAAFILNDINLNQISIFSPSAAANLNLCNKFKNINFKNIHCAIIAPDMPDRMAALTQECIDNGIPYIFDPGQAITALSKEYLNMMIKCCLGLIVNNYESGMIEDKLEISIEKIADNSGFLIRTLGRKGCQILQSGKRKNIPAVPNISSQDATGCGDAFRAGFIHGFVLGHSMERCCEIANTVASFAADKTGTQSHSFTYDEFMNRLKKYYGE